MPEVICEPGRALVAESGDLIVDETDGDNIILEDDPEFVEYIIL